MGCTGSKEAKSNEKPIDHSTIKIEEVKKESVNLTSVDISNENSIASLDEHKDQTLDKMSDESKIVEEEDRDVEKVEKKLNRKLSSKRSFLFRPLSVLIDEQTLAELDRQVSDPILIRQNSSDSVLDTSHEAKKLFNIHDLQRKLRSKGMKSLIRDMVVRYPDQDWCDQETRDALKLLCDCLKLAQPAFQSDIVQGSNTELCTQIHARLLRVPVEGRNEKLNNLISDCVAWVDSNRGFLLINPSLAGPLHPCELILPGHHDSVTCVSFLGNNRVVSGSLDGSLRLWNLLTGSCTRVFRGHRREVTCICPVDEETFASGSVDRSIRVWNTNRSENNFVFTGHGSYVSCLCRLQNGKIISGSDDRTIRVWNIETKECEGIYSGHSDRITSLCETESTHFISGAADGTIKVWNVVSNFCEFTLIGHLKKVNDICALVGNQIISVSSDKTLRIWDLTSGSCTRVVDVERSLYKVAVVSEGKLALGLGNGLIRILDFNGNFVRDLSGHSSAISGFCTLGNCRFVSASEDRVLRVWDLKKDFKNSEHTDRVSGIQKLGPDRAVTYAVGDLTCRIWNVKNGKTEKKLAVNSNVTCVCTIGESLVVTGSVDCLVRVWNVVLGETRRVFEGHKKPISCLCSLGDERVVSGSEDSSIRVWSIISGLCEWVLEGEGDLVCGLCPLAYNRFSSSYRDGHLCLWDAITGMCQWEVDNGMVAPPRNLGLNKIVCGSAIFEIENGQVEKEFPDHFVFQTIIGDSLVVFKSAIDGTMKVFNWNYGDLEDIESPSSWFEFLEKYFNEHSDGFVYFDMPTLSPVYLDEEPTCLYAEKHFLVVGGKAGTVNILKKLN